MNPHIYNELTSDKGARTIQWEKNNSLTNGNKITEVDPFFNSLMKIN